MQNFRYDIHFSAHKHTYATQRKCIDLCGVYWKWAETKEKLSDSNIISVLHYSWTVVVVNVVLVVVTSSFKYRFYDVFGDFYGEFTNAHTVYCVHCM